MPQATPRTRPDNKCGCSSIERATLGGIRRSNSRVIECIGANEKVVQREWSLAVPRSPTVFQMRSIRRPAAYQHGALEWKPLASTSRAVGCIDRACAPSSRVRPPEATTMRP